MLSDDTGVTNLLRKHLRANGGKWPEEIFPLHCNHDAILAHARRMGWHRVQIARHYPTDIYTGRVLAQAIVNQMRKNDNFGQDFKAVRTRSKPLAGQP